MLLAEDEWHSHLAIACGNSFQLLDYKILYMCKAPTNTRTAMQKQSCPV